VLSRSVGHLVRVTLKTPFSTGPGSVPALNRDMSGPKNELTGYPTHQGCPDSGNLFGVI